MEKAFMSIREVARAGIISEHYLRLMEKQGILPGVYSGRKKLVNVAKLLEVLNAASEVKQ